MEAVKTLLSISTCGSFGKARSFFGKGTAKLHVPEAPLTPQTSDNESDEEREREAASQAGQPEMMMVQPMDLVISERKDKPEEDKMPARVSVIMRAHSDGTFEPANIFGRTGAEQEQEEKRQRKNTEGGNNVGGRFEMDPSKNFPPPEEPPSRKTDGSEMTSGHRDKNIPMTGGAMALSGDALKFHSSPNRIATTSRVPVLISESPNLHHSANSTNN